MEKLSETNSDGQVGRASSENRSSATSIGSLKQRLTASDKFKRSEMTPKVNKLGAKCQRPPAIREKHAKKLEKFLLRVVMLVLCTTLICITLTSLVSAQYSYGGGGQPSYSMAQQDQTSQEFEGPEDRPKVRLGIRLRIPAFKFELPRLQLPKITVSAKIRQPDGPRIIQLPEINFDTSSKVAPPSVGGGGGGDGAKSGGYSGQYQASPSYSMASYGGGGRGGGQAGRSNTFTFSTGEESEHPQQQQQNYYQPARYNYAASSQYRAAGPGHSYGGSSGSSVAYQAATPMMSPMAAYYRRLPHAAPQSAASATTKHTASAPRAAAYSLYSKPAGGAQSFAYQVSEPPTASRNPELGFNAPVQMMRPGEEA